MILSKFLPTTTSGTFQKVACAAGLLILGSAGYWMYRRLKQKTNPPIEHAQPATLGREPRPLPPGYEVQLEETDDFQVVMSNWQLVSTDQQTEEEPVIVLSEGNGELSITDVIIQFLCSDSDFSETETLLLRTYYVCVVEGSVVQQWWFTITEASRLNHLGLPFYTFSELYFTGIQTISGKVVEFLSCRRLETSLKIQREDFMQTFCEVTRDYMRLWPDGQEDSAHWVKKSTILTPLDVDCESDSESDSESDYESDSESDSETDFEGSDEGLPPEKGDIPFISGYLKDRGISDITVKLPALREVFSTLLKSIQLQNLLFVSGKQLVMHLAALNKKDVPEAQLSFEALIRYLKQPANQTSIMSEMSKIQMPLNLLDIVYELVLFGWFVNGYAPDFVDGGFLDSLYMHILSWDTETWEPAAEQCFTVIKDQLTEFLVAVFSQPPDLYKDAGRLSSVVLNLLMHHVQQMLKAEKKI